MQLQINCMANTVPKVIYINRVAQKTFDSLTRLFSSDLLKHSITQNVYVDILL